MDRATPEMRRHFAEAIGLAARVQDRRVVEAFAAVPREDFIGSAPWFVGGDFSCGMTSDVAKIYTDRLIALDAAQGVNNGQPSLWAGVFDALDIPEGAHVAHLGAGGGYYTAILAELVGEDGSVSAYEIDPALAERARAALAPWPQVALYPHDGAAAVLASADVVVASAGATHPAPTWLAALKIGGRLCFPLTGRGGHGAMLLATRRSETLFDARFLFSVAFVDFSGLRDPEMERRLAVAFRRGDMDEVKSLRLGPPNKDSWLAGADWSLSRAALKTYPHACINS